MKIFITEVIIDVGDLKSGLKFLLRILVKILVKIWIKNFQIKYFKIIWHKIRGGFLDPFQIRITDRDLSAGNLASKNNDNCAKLFVFIRARPNYIPPVREIYILT